MAIPDSRPTQLNQHILPSPRILLNQPTLPSRVNLLTQGNLLTQEHTPLSQEHTLLNQEHTPLNQEHTPLNQEHTQLNQEHTQLNQERTPLLISRQIQQPLDIQLWVYRTDSKKLFSCKYMCLHVLADREFFHLGGQKVFVVIC